MNRKATWRGIPMLGLAALFAGLAISPGSALALDESSAPQSLPQRIDTEARRILAHVKSSVYAHKSHVDEAQGVYELDCSGLVDLVLKAVSPKHLGEVETRRGHKRQLAEDYVQTFEESPTKPKSDAGWQRIERVSDAQPGDILAWKNLAHKQGEHTNTGHVMVIDEAPVEETPNAVTSKGANSTDNSTADNSTPSQKTYRIRVIDSTASAHADDTRTEGQSGVGRGTLWLVVDAAGKPIGYHWKSSRGALHQVPIAIGRAVSGE